MKLGVFGDSFAVSWCDTDPYWANVLRYDYGYDVTNYAHGGTGLDYSYYHFLKNYEKFDKIIFVVGHPHRKTYFDYKCKDTIFPRLDHLSKISHLEPNSVVGAFDGYLDVSHHISAVHPDRTTKRVLSNKLEEWATFPESDYLTYYAMQRDIIHTHPETTLIPAFAHYTPYGMYNISDIDYKKFRTHSEIHHRRFNHMSSVQTAEFAKYIALSITDGFDVNSTLGDDVEKYYSSSKNTEEAGLNS